MNVFNAAFYAIHYTPLTERSRNIRHIEHIIGNSIEIVTEHISFQCTGKFAKSPKLDPLSKAELAGQILSIKDLLTANLNALNKSSSPSQYLDDASMFRWYLNQAIDVFSEKNQVLTLQHQYALNLFIESPCKCDYCIIIEDDAIPYPESLARLHEIVNYISVNFDARKSIYCDLTDSLGLQLADSKLSLPIFQVERGRTRCSCGYLVNRSAAVQLISHNESYLMPIDWFYSYLLKELDIPTFWSSSPVFSQGSELGLFNSNSPNRSS
jgi:hypothetical protein